MDSVSDPVNEDAWSFQADLDCAMFRKVYVEKLDVFHRKCCSMVMKEDAEPLQMKELKSTMDRIKLLRKKVQEMDVLDCHIVKDVQDVLQRNPGFDEQSCEDNMAENVESSLEKEEVETAAEKHDDDEGKLLLAANQEELRSRVHHIIHNYRTPVTTAKELYKIQHSDMLSTVIDEIAGLELTSRFHSAVCEVLCLEYGFGNSLGDQFLTTLDSIETENRDWTSQSLVNLSALFGRLFTMDLIPESYLFAMRVTDSTGGKMLSFLTSLLEYLQSESEGEWFNAMLHRYMLVNEEPAFRKLVLVVSKGMIDRFE